MLPSGEIKSVDIQGTQITGDLRQPGSHGEKNYETHWVADQEQLMQFITTSLFRESQTIPNKDFTVRRAAATGFRKPDQHRAERGHHGRAHHRLLGVYHAAGAIDRQPGDVLWPQPRQTHLG